MSSTRQIRVTVTPIEMGFLEATSLDLPGMFSASRRLDDLLEDIPKAVIELLGMDGEVYTASKPVSVGPNEYIVRAYRVDKDLKRAC